MNVFGLALSPRIIDAIAAHGEEDYPKEACGVVLARPHAPELERVVRMRNVQDKYHARDPVQFPRDARDAFRFDELERMRVLDAAQAEGLVERVIYHSHCEAGAYFSPEDRAAAVQGGIELVPNVVHIVVSVKAGKRDDMAAFRWNAESKTFEEARIPLSASSELLPDLELRAMADRRETARPIRAVGGCLAARRITAEERLRLEHLAEKIQVRVESEVALADLARFELGLLSPLAGFLRSVEVRSIEQSGRLLSGTPWRTPVTLEISAKKTAVLPTPGALVELIDPAGVPRAAMGLTEVHRLDKDLVRLAGPVYVFDGHTPGHASDTRAELLRRGAKRILAIPAAAQVSAEARAGFDVVLTPQPASPQDVAWVLSGRDPWLDAAMAQNQGATHIWVEDPALAHAITQTLSIEPWHV